MNKEKKKGNGHALRVWLEKMESWAAVLGLYPRFLSPPCLGVDPTVSSMVPTERFMDCRIAKSLIWSNKINKQTAVPEGLFSCSREDWRYNQDRVDGKTSNWHCCQSYVNVEAQLQGTLASTMYHLSIRE